MPPSALYRWLEDPPDGQPRAPPPPSLPPPPTEDGPVVDGPPPRRSTYRRGKKGRRIFHRERAEWYERATGERLEGSLEEQHARFHGLLSADVRGDAPLPCTLTGDLHIIACMWRVGSGG